MHGIFRKGILAALVIGLIVGVVGLSQANYNIRQNPSGTTDWVDNDALRVGGTDVVRVGRQYINLRITSATTAMTHYIVSPISGVLFSAFAVQNSNPVSSITTNLTFGIQAPLSPGRFIHPTTGAFIALVPTQAAGTVFYNRPSTSGNSFTRTPGDVTAMAGNVSVRRGSIISIASGGEGDDSSFNGGGVGEYDVWIIIDPR